jgi:hypothetical protein
MSYYLVSIKDNITRCSNFIYGSDILEEVLSYVNENPIRDVDVSIYEYILQDNECYCEVRNHNHFFVYNKSREIVESIREQMGFYEQQIIDYIDYNDDNTLLDKLENAKEQWKRLANIYDSLYEVYGSTTGSQNIDSNCKFRNITRRTNV